MSNSLWPQGLQHTRGLFCPSLPPGVCSNSCSLNQYCHSTISCPVTPFSCPQSFPALGLFPNDAALHIRWPKSWSFNMSINPSDECSGLISLRIDWFDLLAVHGTLKNLLQHNSKVSVLWCSAFFMVQVSHPYITTGKIITFIMWTFVSKVMSLLFNMLAFHRLLIDLGQN